MILDLFGVIGVGITNSFYGLRVAYTVYECGILNFPLACDQAGMSNFPICATFL